ncbi:MAG: DUF4115 domain-containing protein [Gammaproteobacteria bacterium]|nr:DUF4115 domain-containing protein [Gammaproteobacteria bacterium]
MDAKVTTGSSEQFKQAREQQKLTVQEVAARLNLPVARIEEIEKGEYSDTVSATFYRGYIRNYAQLLKISPDDLLNEFSTIFGTDVQITTAQRVSQYSPSRRTSGSSTGFKWLSLVILVLIICAVGFGIKQKYFAAPAAQDNPVELSPAMNDNESTVATPAAPTLEQTRTNPTVSTGKTTGAELGSSVPDNSATQVKPAATVTAEPVATTQSSTQPTTPAASNTAATVNDNSAASVLPKTTDNSATLSLIFVGDCWIDIKDATGERLAYGIKENGKVINLSGTPPYSVTLGDPSVVRVQFDDKTIDLSGYRAGQTARLTIE